MTCSHHVAAKSGKIFHAENEVRRRIGRRRRSMSESILSSNVIV